MKLPSQIQITRIKKFTLNLNALSLTHSARNILLRKCLQFSLSEFKNMSYSGIVSSIYGMSIIWFWVYMRRLHSVFFQL